MQMKQQIALIFAIYTFLISIPLCEIVPNTNKTYNFFLENMHIQ